MTTLRSRTRDGSWQWLMIGVVLGLGFSVVICLGAYAAGLIRFNSGGGSPVEEPLVQPTVLVSEVAVLPSATPTMEQEVIIVTATSSGLTIVQPTETPPMPTPPPTEEVPTDAPVTESSDVTAEPGAEGTPLATPTEETVIPEGGIDPVLESIRSAVVMISGGDYIMGTTQSEVANAVSECLNVYGGACDPSFAEDSFPPHSVVVNSFMMEENEVTAGQYITFLNSVAMGPGSHLNGCNGQPCAATLAEEPASNITYDGTLYTVPDIVAQLPATHVTWYGAQAYCEAIDRRLPTEAEWERAARGSDNRVYPWGNEWAPTLANTNRRDNTGVATSSGPEDVGSFPEGRGPYGNYDLAGNVAEWVSDWYQADFYAQPEATGLTPQGPVFGTTKVARGGSWDAVPFFARGPHRQDFDPLTQSLVIGFRCVSDDVENAAAGGSSEGTGPVIAPPTGVAIPTEDPNATQEPIPTLVPGG